jgi:hypothetical protein
VVELSPGDALASDDHAYGRVPQGRSLPVVMLPAGSNPWVKRALLADPDVELLGAPLSALDGTAVPEDALLVIDGACPRALPSNDVLILNPPEGACEDVGVGRIVENASITSWAEADPRFRFLGLDGVQLAKARSVQTSGPNQALLHAGATTIASDISTPERTGTLLAFDVQDSNWPLKASFVLFLRNVVELSRAHRAHGALESARTGETLRLRVPADVSRVSLEQPGGTSVDVSARDGLAILPDTYRTGFYHASWQGKRPGSVLFATNLLSEAESDLRPHALRREGRELRASAGRDVPRGFSDLSWLFALLALSFMALDVWWLTRSQRRRLELAPDRAAMRLGMAARERARRSGA